MAKKIEVQIVGDADSLHRALSKAQGSTSKFGSVAGAGLKAAAIGVGAAMVGLGVAAKIGFDEFEQGQAVAAQTAAVLKSTGGAANVTAKQVDQLGLSLMKKSGIDDEAIKSGENLLLTFRNIHNEAGKGNDIFNQATKAATDLSVAFGKDLPSSAILVGKALNDPIKGLTALQRIGVTFTDGQKKMITSLVNSGKTMQAQKLILGELTKQTGGSAKAFGETVPGQLNILKETFKNSAGEIVSSFVPILLKVAQFVLPLVTTALQAVAKFLTSLGQTVSGASDQVGGFGNKVSAFAQTVIHWFQGNIMPVVMKLKTIFQQAFAAIAQTVQQHGAELGRIANRIGAVLKAIATVAIPILRFALVKVLPVAIGIVITALDKLTRWIGNVIDAIKWVGKNAGGAFNALKSAVKTLAGVIATLAAPILTVLGKIRDAIQWILDHAPSIPDIPTFGGNAGGTTGKVPQLPRAVLAGGGSGAASSRPLQANLYLDSRLVYSAIVSQDKITRRQTGRSLLVG